MASLLFILIDILISHTSYLQFITLTSALPQPAALCLSNFLPDLLLSAPYKYFLSRLSFSLHPLSALLRPLSADTDQEPVPILPHSSSPAPEPAHARTFRSLLLFLQWLQTLCSRCTDKVRLRFLRCFPSGLYSVCGLR